MLPTIFWTYYHQISFSQEIFDYVIVLSLYNGITLLTVNFFTCGKKFFAIFVRDLFSATASTFFNVVFTPVQWDKFEGVRCVPTMGRSTWLQTPPTSVIRSLSVLDFRVSKLVQNVRTYFLLHSLTPGRHNSQFWTTSIDWRSVYALFIHYPVDCVSDLQLLIHHDSDAQNGCK